MLWVGRRLWWEPCEYLLMAVTLRSLEGMSWRNPCKNLPVFLKYYFINLSTILYIKTKKNRKEPDRKKHPDLQSWPNPYLATTSPVTF